MQIRVYEKKSSDSCEIALMKLSNDVSEKPLDSYSDSNDKICLNVQLRSAVAVGQQHL